MINKVHYSHLGFNKCCSIANESIFWPGMINEIKQILYECPICLKFAKSQIREPIISYEIPDLPWNKVGSDIFEFNSKKYLIVIDYYSKFLEIEELSSLMSSKVIQALKKNFSRHGIPLKFVSDGGTQFTSKEFKDFAKFYDFTHIISSPTNAQSNGLAERNVQTAKNIFKKVLNDLKDLDLALLDYRNTPVLGNISPAEALMSRKLRTTLPALNETFKPKLVNKNVENSLKQNRLF